VFSDRSLRDALQENGFRVLDSHRQFVLPIAFHKRLGSASATRRIERALDAVGLRRMLGSPVTMVAERAGRERVEAGRFRLAVRKLWPGPGAPGRSRAQARPHAQESGCVS
jgi:hypothetical protein